MLTILVWITALAVLGGLIVLAVMMVWPRA